MSEGCDCEYESLDAPGVKVLPIIVRPPPSGLSIALELLLNTIPHMRPGGLYRCRLCGVYVYIQSDFRPLELRAHEWRPSAE